MELEWVQAFLAVAETGSFSAAAEGLFLSQSVVSKQVQRLERHLNVSLFDRTRRKVELTDAGRRAYPEAQNLVLQYRRLEQAAHPGGTLRLAMLPVADCYGFPQMLTEFSVVCPEIQLLVDEQENAAMPALLQAGRCDGAFCRLLGHAAAPSQQLLCEDEMALLLPAALPCPAAQRVPLALFSGENFLLLGAGTGLLEASLSLCSQAGFSPQVRYTGSSAGNIARMVRSGAGVALLARRVAESCLGPGLKLAVPEPNCKSLLVFCPSRAGLQNPAMPRLLEHLARTACPAEGPRAAPAPQ